MQSESLPERNLHQFSRQLQVRMPTGIGFGTGRPLLLRHDVFRSCSHFFFVNNLCIYLFICFVFFPVSVDSRRDVCYAHFRDGQCLNPSTSLVTKSSCCCCTVITGQPMGWGTPCQSCPSPDSEEFEQLCPFGSGKTHSGDGNILAKT